MWSRSEAPILAYMDVDLSTDLDGLWPLVAPLMSGHSDLAIGSRLAHGSRVVRGARREVISRAYNVLLRRSLGARFTDAQCGFKAIRADVAAELLPMVEDPAWFFDTELLVLAERCGLRIHEVPVDWYDDPDSRVDVVRTAMDDLHGIVRLRRAIASGRLPLEAVRERIGRHPAGAGVLGQAWRFAGVGLGQHGPAPGPVRLARDGAAVGAGRQPAGAAGGHRREHGRQPALDVRRARAAAPGPPAPAGPHRLRAHLGA